MPECQVSVTTGKYALSGTCNDVYVTIHGSEGKSERTKLDNWGPDLMVGQTRTYTVPFDGSLGQILFLKVEKENGLFFIEDQWYCSKMVVTPPDGNPTLFPCYRWISTGERVELRGGKAVKVTDEVDPLLVKQRTEELSLKKETYRWRSWAEGLPHSIDMESSSELPSEMSFSYQKYLGLVWPTITAGIEFKLKGMLGSTERFESLEDMKNILKFKSTTISEYVAEHWKEDEFFGYQFLNGLNPNRIQKCTELPKNFKVTDDMVKPFFEEEGSSLKEEMEAGKIFIYDLKRMDGIPGRDDNGERLPVTPGLCLFYLNQKYKLMPIAIQLQQQPSEMNPIFLPSDSETDWLLAKMYIKNADLMDHESVHHLTNTHLLAEVFAVATLRCLPEIHPLHKLLIPHFRYTLNINITGRPELLKPGKPLDMSSLGSEGILELMRRSLKELTYKSLCLPENITERGMESVPNFYYRDDGFRLWDIINSFVKEMVKCYYPKDCDVQTDSELQEWISEIFTHGFLGNKASGFPESFSTVEELIKFITVVIFTVSAQHAALNNGQFDYAVFIPNAPFVLRKPPPTTKGQTSQETILETLPNMGEAATSAAILNLLSQPSFDQVLLGQYPDQRFDEPAVEKRIRKFQDELSRLSRYIAKRNAGLDIPYRYLNPQNIDNSIET